MPNKQIISLLLALFIGVSSTAFSQRRPKNKKIVHRNKVHKRVTVKRYSRRNIVVVKRRRVTTIRTLPVGHKVIVHKGNNHYVHKGVFYRKIGGQYTTVIAPRGLRIKTLPIGYRTIKMRGVHHYYYRGVFYQKINNEYQTVAPETGILISSLPDEDTQEVTIDGTTFYECNGTLYKKKGNGYEVVGELDD